MGLEEIGRTLLVIGLVLVLLGAVLVLAGRIPALSLFGRLPGDIVVRRGNGIVFIPLATSLLLSVVLTLLLNLVVNLIATPRH